MGSSACRLTLAQQLESGHFNAVPSTVGSKSWWLAVRVAANVLVGNGAADRAARAKPSRIPKPHKAECGVTPASCNDEPTLGRIVFSPRVAADANELLPTDSAANGAVQRCRALSLRYECCCTFQWCSAATLRKMAVAAQRSAACATQGRSALVAPVRPAVAMHRCFKSGPAPAQQPTMVVSRGVACQVCGGTQPVQLRPHCRRVGVEQCQRSR